MVTRYDPSGAQAEFEPGSRCRVLRNLLEIRRVRDIELAESQALQLAQERAVQMFTADHRFSAADICQLHRVWLGPIYAWAGEYRMVNLGKGGFQFATAVLIPGLMAKLERNELARYTPCVPATDGEVANALAIVHAELVVLHPFRDGNGRVARLLALLMALQAGLPPLDFSPLDGRGKRRYIAGIQAAMGGDYRLLTEMFVKVIDRTWKSVSSSGR
jgi:cell filamentation protein